ncbi:N-formylglutamate amidohydrolase [Cupriavidus basilensis]
MNDSFEPFVQSAPQDQALPLVCDSPHSGTCYPQDFGCGHPAAAFGAARTPTWNRCGSRASDRRHADRREFPRVYIDPNRTLEDLDPELLDGTWPGRWRQVKRRRLGYGLIWRNVDAATRIYDRKLSLQEVRSRIDRYYRPYHQAPSAAVEGPTSASVPSGI